MMRRVTPGATPVRPVAPHLAGRQGFYSGPFYTGAPEARRDRRLAVLLYLPHTYRESTRIVATCRVCGFPRADAPCAEPIQETEVL